MRTVTDQGLDFVIDSKTGEVLRSYSVTRDLSYTAPRIQPRPDEATSEEHLTDICRELGEKASYKTIFNVSELKTSDTDSYVKILKLCKWLRYRNIVIVTRDDISLAFNISLSSVGRTLKRLEAKDLIKFTSKGLSERGLVKIFINPSLVWKGDYQVRQIKIMKWYNRTPMIDLVGEENSSDNSIEVDRDKVYSYRSIEEYEQEYDHLSSHDTPEILIRILALSDEEFSLYLLGEIDI